MRRLMLYDRLGNPLGELAESDVFEAVLREEINGEHSLEITTTRVLDKGIRMLYKDGRSKWREFVVAGVDAEHASGNRAIGTYYCVWSVQQDLQGVTVSVMPGVQTPTTAALALDALLSTTNRWTRGTVTQTSTGGASMYDRSAWEALSGLVDVWGGEVDASITVSTQGGVTGRAVDLYAAQGEQTAKRRFDFGADLMSVKRTLADNPLFCRISPRGKGEQTDAGGYGRKITIESVNGGLDYLTYQPMVDVAKLPNGNGGYEYPTLIVENSNCETPTALKTWAQGVLAEYCTPKVTYEVDVVQAGIEGVDVTGVSLGDAVQVVDRKFGGDGIRVEGRIRSITTDLLNERDISIVIGDAEDSISSKFASVDKSLAAVSNDLTVMSTAEYIDNLLERINTEINATGGYTYIVPGNGILTFDVAVADPLNPVEASQVVEVKGGSIRIANSKTAQGAWEWKTVFTSGHIAASLVTAANIVTGYIGSAGDTFIDLDNHTVQLGQTNNSHLTVSTSNINFYQGSTNVGSLGSSTLRLGATNEPHITLGSSSGLCLYDNAQNVIGQFTRDSSDQVSIRLGLNATGKTYSLITESGFGVYRSGNSVAYFGVDANGVPVCSIGNSSRSRIDLSGNGSVDIKGGGVMLAHFGYASGYNAEGTLSDAPYYTLGKRSSGGAIGNWSVAEGVDTVASAAYSHAGGYQCKALGVAAFAFGWQCRAEHEASVALGIGCETGAIYQTVIGEYNTKRSTAALVVGDGDSSSSKANIMYLSKGTGDMWIKGSYSNSSDRRLKEHIAYLGDDACELIRKLKPALFVKDGERHVGFYAQDVQEAEPDSWDTVTVRAEHTDESLDFDPLTLEYPALIAPLVAYCQHLEKRIEQLEAKVNTMEVC